MTTAELVNLIVCKFGGNRVTFIRIKQKANGYATADFKLGGNKYSTAYCPNLDRICARITNGDATGIDNYSRWVEGILNGMVRNEQGELVQP